MVPQRGVGLDNECYNTYCCAMANRLRDEIKQQAPFVSPEQEAYLNIIRTAAVLEHAVVEGLRSAGVTPTQYNALRILRGAGPLGLCRNELRDRMVRAVPDATRLLDRLEGAGLIRRDREGTDRRFVTAHITKKGLDLLEQLDAPLTELHRTQLEHMSRAELRQLTNLLSKARAGN